MLAIIGGQLTFNDFVATVITKSAKDYGGNIVGILFGAIFGRIIVETNIAGTLVRKTAEERQQALEGIDALMTNIEEVCIGVSTADCIPVLLYDPEHRAVCAIHAGWRGTVKRITEQAVQKMIAVYGSRPADMVAQIGPGISLDSFEVGDEVYETFANEGFPMESISKKRDKWHIDLPTCNRLQLESMGVPAQHISVSPVCTFKQTDSFFSARRLGINSGRIFTAIILHP